MNNSTQGNSTAQDIKKSHGKQFSLLFPVIYLGGFALIFYLFALYNKKQKLVDQIRNKYFDIHVQKIEYDELAELFGLEGNGRIILETALLRRAVEDVARSTRIQEEKPPLQQMVHEGIVSEDLMDKISLAEQELQLELQEVIIYFISMKISEEADMFKKGWRHDIFKVFLPMPNNH